MRNRRYSVTLRGCITKVEAESEGSCRYMVRMVIPRHGRVRIGYLTGSGRSWHGEYFDGRPQINASTAAAICRQLATTAADSEPLKSLLWNQSCS